MKRLLRLLFGCRHPRASWIFRDQHGCYQRCLSCGTRLTPRVQLEGRRAA